MKTGKAYINALALVCAAGALLLSGYASARDFRAISPKNAVHNAPVPVPYPRVKPTPPPVKAAKAKPLRAQPKAKPATTALAVTVRKGDTVYGLARRHGVDPKNLIRANALQSPYILVPGQKLSLGAPRTHTVKRGETGYRIAARYDVGMAELMRLNRIKAPYRLQAGQKLVIPPQESAAAQPAVLSVPARTGSHFSWPAYGAVISRFGVKQGGYRNDGINIRVRPGTKVKAAEAGVVVYAGNRIKGFGNLLLIRHDGGWITTYGHNADLLVSRGDTVKRGQEIATAGQSGNVSEPQIHFEIRKGITARDPLRYLETQTASASSP